ncbi:YALI0A07645p [Yarrowia lipolytica CLIB122]|uniref:YALI0A07645p n=1 Tax=Yarrowia lipolytica (strain CLIB 122 / E 150) TaxID=284591 RepID=Q6CHL5_YARLI|nr:YALI0A07645p [Yarrowia lipolytica CLIB122]CAG83772.1 YALI0A07645p [Yarrowia lipolytica CLIB122]|eukprot:XP_499846.1 YALI0A07645p [Yarrowia lipolytica CLIB122]
MARGEDQAALDTLTDPRISTSNPAVNALQDILQERCSEHHKQR